MLMPTARARGPRLCTASFPLTRSALTEYRLRSKDSRCTVPNIRCSIASALRALISEWRGTV